MTTTFRSDLSGCPTVEKVPERNGEFTSKLPDVFTRQMPELNNHAAEINIVVCSLAGGSGSTSGPLGIYRLLDSDAIVIVIAVVDTVSQLDAANSIDTLDGLVQYANENEKYIPIMLFENSVNTKKVEVNRSISRKLQALLSFFTSTTVEEVDYNDRQHFLNPVLIGADAGAYGFDFDLRKPGASKWSEDEDPFVGYTGPDLSTISGSHTVLSVNPDAQPYPHNTIANFPRHLPDTEYFGITGLEFDPDLIERMETDRENFERENVTKKITSLFKKRGRPTPVALSSVNKPEVFMGKFMPIVVKDIFAAAKAKEIDVMIHGCNIQVNMGAGIAKLVRQKCPTAWNMISALWLTMCQNLAPSTGWCVMTD